MKESAEMEKAPKKTQSKHFNWKSITKDENPELVVTNFFQGLYSIPEDQEEATQSERRHWVELWKNMRIDCAGGMLISPKKLENVLKKLKNGKGSPDHITADVLKALPSRMFGEVGEVAVVGVLERGFPGRLGVFVDGNGPESGGCNVLDQVQANRWTVCDAKSLWLKSLPPLRFESVQTAFVPKTHSDTGLFLLLKAAELSREWQREIVVVQLDVKKAFDHVDHRAAFKAMKLQGVSLFSMVLIAAIWSGSCMKACLGTVTSNKVQMSRGLPQGAPESPVIFTMIMELVLRDLIKSWITLKLAWRLYDFALAAICYADDVVLVAVSMSASEIMVTEALAKLKEVGLTVGAQKTHWTSFPKMMDKNITVDGSAVVWEEVLEFVGSMVCFDRNARHAIAHRTAQANKCMAKWRPVLSSSWLPRLLRLNIVKTTMWQAFFWSSSVWTTVKAQRDKNCELECEDGGERHGWNWTSGGDSGTELVIDGSKRAKRTCGLPSENVCSAGLVMLPGWTTKKFVRRP